MRRFDIINEFIKKYGYKKYCEIGVQKSKSFNNVKCEYSVGVDPDQSTKATHHMTSDEYFKKNKDRFDIFFVDGLHHSDQVYKDIINCLERLEDDGTIICHDMNPREEVYQKVPRETKVWNGDCWKAFVRLRTERDNLEMYVIDADEGCAVIRKGSQEKLDISGKGINYDNLSKYRKKWLNLISVDEFKKLMGILDPTYNIWQFIPYALDKNYGNEIKKCCDLVKDENDIIVINDADCMSLTPANIHVLKDAIDKAPEDWGMLIPYVSRIGQKKQVYDVGSIENGDMRHHRNIALKLEKEPLKFIKFDIPISGAVMVFRKKTFTEVGGVKDGLLGCDNNLSNKIRRSGKSIYLVNRLYYLHYYRLNEGMSYKNHLK